MRREEGEKEGRKEEEEDQKRWLGHQGKLLIRNNI